jgi:hypothetical protein
VAPVPQSFLLSHAPAVPSSAVENGNSKQPPGAGGDRSQLYTMQLLWPAGPFPPAASLGGPPGAGLECLGHSKNSWLTGQVCMLAPGRGRGPVQLQRAFSIMVWSVAV